MWELRNNNETRPLSLTLFCRRQLFFLASPHPCATQPLPSKAGSPANRKHNQERSFTLNTLLSNKMAAQGKTNYRYTCLHTIIEGFIKSLYCSHLMHGYFQKLFSCLILWGNMRVQESSLLPIRAPEGLLKTQYLEGFMKYIKMPSVLLFFHLVGQWGQSE